MSNARTTELLEVSFANKGSKEITGTDAVTPTTGEVFTCLQALEDTIVSAQTDTGTTNADLSAFTLISEGTFIYGRWSSITLASGSMIGYYG